jgi:acyl dehydratase
MPLDTSLVGITAGPVASEIDARWTMAYAAGIDDTAACYLDTRRPEGIVAHPVFPVCFEWPAALAIRAKSRGSLAQAEASRGVHATQHMILHRAVRPPMRLTTTATLVGMEARKPGAYEVAKFETVDDKGAPVCTTYSGSIYRQVEIRGAERPAAMPKPPLLVKLPAKPRAEIKVAIPTGAAHVYTECARIWNPVHTDAAVAAAAGLPAIILHGTATLAMAVSRIVMAEAGGDPERIAEIYGRFGAMVLMPSEVLVRIHAREKAAGGEAVFFEAISAEGGRAIRDGIVMLRG